MPQSVIWSIYQGECGATPSQFYRMNLSVKKLGSSSFCAEEMKWKTQFKLKLGEQKLGKNSTENK